MRRLASLLTALLLAALLVVACGGPSAPPGPLFVNPTSGSDAAKGTTTEPLKTLGRAFELVKEGGEVYLQAGTYRDEAWPLAVPKGVTLGSVTAGDAVLVSAVAGTKTALTFASGGAVKDLRIQDFEVGITASSGEVRLVGVTFVGIKVQAVSAAGDSEVTVQSCVFQNLASAGAVRAIEDATVTLTGGSVSGGNIGLFASETARLSASNLTVANANYSLYVPGGEPEVTLSDMTVTDTVRSAVYVRDSTAKVTLDNVTIDGAGEMGVSAQDFLGELWLNGGKVTGASSGLPAVQMVGDDDLEEGGTLYIQGTRIVDNLGFGLQVGGFGRVEVRGATISGNAAEGVSFFEPASLLLRGTTIQLNGGRGVYLRGFGTVTSMVSMADLGNSLDPGLNTIRANGLAGLYAFDSSIGAVRAAGNTWNANVQGASAAGQMTAETVLTGPVDGTNFHSNNAVQFWF